MVKPSPKKALEFIKKNHQKIADKTILQIIGDCMVDYRGRARSLLDWGERIIMIKQDGAVLVHRPIMREPVNWQPTGSKTVYRQEKKKLVIYNSHKHPQEKMKIIFRDIKLIFSTNLKDNGNLAIAGMEADVVNQIISNPDFIEQGLRITKREKYVKSGLIDLFGYDCEHIPVVIEVKRSLANISAAQQLRMYVNDIKKDIKKANVRGILCAPRVPDLVKKLLCDYDLEWREVERPIVLADDWQKTLKDF